MGSVGSVIFSFHYGYSIRNIAVKHFTKLNQGALNRKLKWSQAKIGMPYADQLDTSFVMWSM